MAQQVEGDVGLRIDGVARTNDDGVMAAVTVASSRSASSVVTTGMNGDDDGASVRNGKVL